MKLKKSAASFIEERIIDKGNALFHEPTTLAVSNNYIYVLANSHLEGFNKNKQSAKGIEDKLTSPVIIIYSQP